MRLYRHALESVCGMLELTDLAQILAVSREWTAAVRSMAAIHASIQRDQLVSLREKQAFRPLPLIEPIVGSPLLRHLAAIQLTHFDCYKGSTGSDPFVSRTSPPL